MPQHYEYNHALASHKKIIINIMSQKAYIMKMQQKTS